MRFDRARRVRKHAEYQHIQAVARRVTSRHFVFLVAARDPAPDAGPLPSRLGLVASRRIGNAVARNRVKRLCRECFRLMPGFVPDGTDLVVIARDGADSLKLQEVRAEWEGSAVTLRRRATEALARTEPQPHVSAAGRPRATHPRR